MAVSILLVLLGTLSTLLGILFMTMGSAGDGRPTIAMTGLAFGCMLAAAVLILEAVVAWIVRLALTSSDG